jgi:hypothetical protein
LSERPRELDELQALFPVIRVPDRNLSDVRSCSFDISTQQHAALCTRGCGTTSIAVALDLQSAAFCNCLDVRVLQERSMPKKPSASLIAHKAINLAGDLTAAEKRVAAVLVDCFNFKTHQCDPALNTVAKLLRLSRRTVIRAINALVLKGYLRKETHGGYFHRNSYEPIWSRFQLDEENWVTHRKQSRYKKSVPDVTLSKGRPCHTEGDGNGTQTFPLNQCPVTSKCLSEEFLNHKNDL